MGVSIWYIVAVAVIFFAFGFGVSEAINFGIQRKFLKQAWLAEKMLEQFASSCRTILSDAWYRKVIRHWQSALIKEFHAVEEPDVDRR